MAGIPQNFQAISNVLPTYNFVDIISGTGYINFYAGTTVDLKILSNYTYYDDIVLEPQVVVDGGNALRYDHDFDVLCNRPLDVQGLGIVNVPIRNYSQNNNQTTYVIAYLRKWDGAVETDIVSNQSRSFASSAVSTYQYSMLSIDLNAPLTHFNKGEYLRLTIMVYSGGTNSNVSYAHDPKSRTAGWDSTGAVPSQLSFQCPVRLDL